MPAISHLHIFRQKEEKRAPAPHLYRQRKEEEMQSSVACALVLITFEILVAERLPINEI